MDQSKYQIFDARPVGDDLEIPQYYKPFVGQLLLSDKEIQARVVELSKEIFDYYKSRPFVILVMLKGGFVFFNALFQELQKLYANGEHSNYLNPEFIRVQSYQNDKSTGKITVHNLSVDNLLGKEVLIVEDIVDSGLTLSHFIETLQNNSVKDLKVVCLMNKYKNRTVGIDTKIDFCGFILEFCPFIVGYGMDYNEYYRDLNHIMVINKDGKENFKV